MTTQLDHFRTVPARTQHEAQLDYILLDGSGSMTEKWWDMMTSLDTYVSTLKKNRLDSRIILATFDSTDCDVVQRDERVSEWISLMDKPANLAGGGTPLYDAINVMGRKLRDLNPERCTIVIATDGEETGSQFTDQTQAKAVLDWCRAHGWNVIFMGCDFNSDRVAMALGATASTSLGVQKRLLSKASEALGRKRAAYGHGGPDINFTEDERQQFGGYLSHKKGA